MSRRKAVKVLFYLYAANMSFSLQGMSIASNYLMEKSGMAALVKWYECSDLQLPENASDQQRAERQASVNKRRRICNFGGKSVYATGLGTCIYGAYASSFLFIGFGGTVAAASYFMNDAILNRLEELEKNMNERFNRLDVAVDRVERTVVDTNQRVRGLRDGQAELKKGQDEEVQRSAQRHAEALGAMKKAEDSLKERISKVHEALEFAAEGNKADMIKEFSKLNARLARLERRRKNMLKEMENRIVNQVQVLISDAVSQVTGRSFNSDEILPRSASAPARLAVVASALVKKKKKTGKKKKGSEALQLPVVPVGVRSPLVSMLSGKPLSSSFKPSSSSLSNLLVAPLLADTQN